MTSSSRKTFSLKVIFLELLLFPSSCSEHLSSQLSFKLCPLSSELRSLGDFVALYRFDIKMLSLFVLIKSLLVLFIVNWVFLILL